MSELGIIIVSHSKNLAQGIVDLIDQVAKDVAITYVGGNQDDEIGTSFEQVQEIIEANTANELLAFFDLGSARMNLEMACDFSEKEIQIMSVPIVEGSYTAAALIQAGVDKNGILEQLNELEIKK
ncbi:dihydroxyacetone kinase phosphoryl donor subunit DhaM [Streptococcus hongkongensis]|nr:PTS system mannnose-specific family transporter subunit IIA [Streptococcus uberis]